MRVLSNGQVPLRAALLIDADNFHDPAQLRAIYSQFGQHIGKGFSCHVHGDARLLYQEDLKPVWREFGARLLPCLPLNKNTTDAALIVDALMLHFQQGVFRFGIASGDADFAPLALQLRELGCEVWCFARKAVAFEAMVGFFDHVVRFDQPPAPERPTLTPAAPPALDALNSAPGLGSNSATSSLTKPLSTAKTEPLGAVRPKHTGVAEPKSSPKPVETEASAALPVRPTPQEIQAVKKILAAFPEWRPHTVKHLNQIGAPLRAAGLGSTNAPLHKLFRQYPSFFTVLPLKGPPTQVRLERPLPM